MENKDVRELIRNIGVKQWQVAEVAGISERTLCVWLRSELTSKRRNTIIAAINRIKTEGLYGCSK